MNEGLIPRRYAKALYLFAREKGEDGHMYTLMQKLAGNFANEESLQRVVSNPFVSAADKNSLLMTAAGADKSDICFVDFLTLLDNNRRLDLVRNMALAYMDLYRKEHRIYMVHVVSAAPLSDEETSRLKSLIQPQLKGGTMEYSSSVDPELLGGFVVTIDNERLDASISNELKQLRLKLLSK